MMLPRDKIPTRVEILKASNRSLMMTSLVATTFFTLLAQDRKNVYGPLAFFLLSSAKLRFAFLGVIIKTSASLVRHDSLSVTFQRKQRIRLMTRPWPKTIVRKLLVIRTYFIHLISSYITTSPLKLRHHLHFAAHEASSLGCC